ncbi:MAG: preprotein translocase subunit SecG [Eubacteriales bacterium]|nr:preprotein translocase subunit SecG [Eubacteriales bacterium]
MRIGGVVMIIALKVVYAIVCVLLILIILLQQSKVSGLSGTIGGAGETYWGKNKARSMEGGLHIATVVLSAAFIVLSLVINRLQ